MVAQRGMQGQRARVVDLEVGGARDAVELVQVVRQHARREAAWALLDESLDRDKLASMTQTVGLSEVPRIAEEILAGKVRGRVVVRLADGNVS